MTDYEEKTWIDKVGQVFAVAVASLFVAIIIMLLVGLLWRATDWTFG